MIRPVARTLGGLLLIIAVLTSLGSLGAAPESTTKKDMKNEDVEKAGAEFQKGKFDDAFKLLQEARKKDPTLPPARLMLARFFFAANQPQLGRNALEQATIEESKHPEIYLTHGSLALGEGRLTEALLCCQTAQELAKENRWPEEQRTNYLREAYAGLAAVAESRKDWEYAETYLRNWLTIDPKNGAARQRLGRAQFLRGNADAAVSELEQASKDDPTLEPAAISMGRLWTLKGDTMKAREWMEKAVQKEPGNAKVHLAFGGWLLEQSRLEDARLHIEKAAQLDSKSKEVDRLRGLFARHVKDWATAEKVFEIGYRDAPADFFATNQLALTLIEMPEEDKRKRAIQLAEINARQYQRNPEALSTLGWCYFKTDRLEDAQKLLSASISGGQATSDTAYFLAKALDKANKPDDVKKLLQGAVDSKGLFVYRKEAETWLEEIKKKDKEKEKEKPNK